MKIGRIVDLSQVVDASTQVYPGDPVPALTIATTIDVEGFNLLHVSIGSQSGTHVDAPYHFSSAGARVDELALSLFVGTGVVADVTGLAPRSRISWSSLEPLADELRPGRILLLHTGWSAHYGTAAYYDHPFLDVDAAREVLDRGVLTIGIDAVNLDETVLDGPHPEGFPVHHEIARRGGVIAENLTQLAAIDFADPLVSLLPIKLGRADGAPVRAVALEML